MCQRSMSSIFLVLTLFIISSAKSQEYDCRTPTGELGVCLNIRQCQPLITLLRIHGTAVGDFLRSSVCGFEGLDPKVCCRMSNDDRTPLSTTTPAPTPPPKDISPNSKFGPLFAPDCGIVDNGTYTRVVGGNPASLGNWPWMAALGYLNQKTNRVGWLCGGSLVSSRHVVTAAHCIYERNDLYIVRLGDLDLNDSVNDGASPIDIPIDRSIIHPEYSPKHYTNDIGILRLEQDVQFSYLIKPICIPYPDEIANKDLLWHTPFIAGWGSVYFRGPSATHLQQLQVPIIDLKKCQDVFKRFKNTIIDNRVLCAGYNDGAKDACQGDSGGPLMYTWANKNSAYKRKAFYLIGIISYGWRCAEPGIPGVYTKTAAFLDFIRNNLN
ncbi:venom protease-like [Chelonus insularis]|uniref:venom protease-like n=1 Tax=Chelonus insularis TaxID=460826 RepID=UPI00158E0EF0|nr:venom protease-like [Chelonus insularis]